MLGYQLTQSGVNVKAIIDFQLYTGCGQCLTKCPGLAIFIIDEIKRAGMGPYQGRTCRHLLLQEIAKETGQNMNNMPMNIFRPPINLLI